MSSVASQDAAGVEPRVLIIMTGGTICMKPSDSGLIPARNFLEEGMMPRPSFNDGMPPVTLDAIKDDMGTRVSLTSLRTPASKFDRNIRYAVLEFDELLDSSSIEAAGWTSIASAVFRNYSLFDGFVVLHGTDSLAYTSSALSFMFQNLGKPIVLTGSQSPIFQLQNDATDNLLGSLIIAGHFNIPEVTLFFHHQLYRGNRATKVSATDYMAFDSPNVPSLATVTAVGVDVRWHMVHRATQLEAVSLRTKMDTAHVACLRVFPGIKPEMVDAVLKVPNLRGLVLESFGAGNTPGGPDGALTKVLADAVTRGITIVNVSQCLSGSVSALYAPATMLSNAGVVLGLDMTSEAALTKLAYLLGLPGANRERVAAKMVVSLRGELSDSSLTTFEHPPNERLPQVQATFATIGHAIAQGDVSVVEQALKASARPMLHERDYLGNTLLHIAAPLAQTDVARLLLSHGASVHVRNASGNTPLDIARRAGRTSTVQLLKQVGAHETE